MTPSNKRRVFLYGLGAPMVAVLIYLGFFYEEPPGDGALISAAQFFVTVDMPERANEQVEELLRRNPDDFQALVMKGAVLEGMKKYQEAIDLYASLVPRAPDEDIKFELQLAVARLTAVEGDPTKALQMTDDLESKNKELLGKKHFLRAVLFEETKNLTKARSALLKASELIGEELEESKKITDAPSKMIPLARKISQVERRLFPEKFADEKSEEDPEKREAAGSSQKGTKSIDETDPTVGVMNKEGSK